MDVIGKIIVIIALLSLAYHFGSVVFVMGSTLQHQNIHYVFSLLFIFIVMFKKRPKLWPLWMGLVGLSLISTAYVHSLEPDLILRSGHPTGPDLFIGVSLIVLGLVACYLAWGIIIPLLSVGFIAYALISPFLPPPLMGPPLSFARLISQLSIGLTGLYGMLLGVSANTLFYFLVFSSVFQITGASRFFFELGKFVGKVSRAGAAQTSVVTSALFGMISGSAVANVSVDGVFTIPWMKKCGYRPEVAAAFEATASTGGQIMPPVMGTAAFLMAGFLGIPYAEVATRAVIPALLYFLCIAIQAELIARRDGIQPLAEERVNTKELVLSAPLFIVPLFLLVLMLSRGHSVGYATGITLLAMFALSLLRKETRPSLANLKEGLTQGVENASNIAVICAAIAPMVSMTTYTGLGVKLPGLVEVASGGVTWVALILTAFICYVLGLGIPTPAVYILMAIIAAPALVRMGLEVFSVHMFVFYIAVFDAITPPVALAALVASRIAGSDFWKTGWEAMKLGMAGLIAAFLFVYNPILLGHFRDPISSIIILVAAGGVVFCVSIFFVGFLKIRLTLFERGLVCISSIALMIYVGTFDSVSLGVGVLTLGLMLLVHWLRKRHLKTDLQVATNQE